MAKWSKDPVVREGQKVRRKAAHKARLRNDSTFRKRFYRQKSLQSNYGISLEDYETLRTAQDGKCGICGIESTPGNKEFAVDHDHETGNIRGLLCFHCNVGIGHLQESVPLILKAAAWLARHS